ncbi:MAG: hypothetical protein F6K28_45475 [Microcoleus sp. SIO2G3]|nr:hypothetical protein [Microcoleus sp. SIO2G3]
MPACAAIRGDRVDQAVGLLTLLQQHRFSIAPNYQFKPIYRFNTRPQGGLPVTIEERSPQRLTAAD